MLHISQKLLQEAYLAILVPSLSVYIPYFTVWSHGSVSFFFNCITNYLIVKTVLHDFLCFITIHMCWLTKNYSILGVGQETGSNENGIFQNHPENYLPLWLLMTLPAELNLLVKLWVFWLCSFLQLADVEKGEGVIDEAMQGPIVTIGVLVYQARNKVGCDSNDESLSGWNHKHRGLIGMDTVQMTQSQSNWVPIHV